MGFLHLAHHVTRLARRRPLQIRTLVARRENHRQLARREQDAKAGAPDREGIRALISPTSLEERHEQYRWPVEALVTAVPGLGSSGGAAEPLACMQRFKLHDFVISAWWGPDPSERNYRMYQDASFNVLLTYRNRANPKYGPDYQLPDTELMLAQKVGLWVILDTYMRNDTPWGGADLDPPAEDHSHHPARPAELAWLQRQYGHHPRLVGYLLGDNCGLHGYMADNAKTLLATAPELFPWMSTNPGKSVV